jgi:GT2 family glycosyltransferase
MAARKAIEKNLKRREINTELFIPEIAKKNNWTLFQPRFNTDSVKDNVTIIIPTKNNAKLLLNCIKSIKKTSLQMPQLIIINDHSKEEDALELFIDLKKDNNIQILNTPYMDDEFNYARLINYAVSNVKTKYFIQLNNDVEALSNNWIEQMMGWYQYKNVGAVGAKLIYPNGKIQHAGVVIGPNGGLADHQFHGLDRNEAGYTALPHIAREVSAVTGACMLTETSLFLEMGGFDEANFAVEFNDVDSIATFSSTTRINSAEIDSSKLSNELPILLI